MLPPRPPSPPSGPPLGTYLNRAKDEAPDPPVPATTCTTARSMKLTLAPASKATRRFPFRGLPEKALQAREPPRLRGALLRRSVRHADASAAAAWRPESPLARRWRVPGAPDRV